MIRGKETAAHGRVTLNAVSRDAICSYDQSPPFYVPLHGNPPKGSHLSGKKACTNKSPAGFRNFTPLRRGLTRL